MQNGKFTLNVHIYLTVQSYSGEVFQPEMALVVTWDSVHHFRDSYGEGLVSMS